MLTAKSAARCSSKRDSEHLAPRRQGRKVRRKMVQIICKILYLSLPNLASLRLGASNFPCPRGRVTGIFAQAAKTFTYSNTKSTRFKKIIFRNLRVLRITIAKNLRGLQKFSEIQIAKEGAMNRAPTRSISFLRLLRFLRLILRVSTGRVRKPALPHLSLRSMRSLRLILLFGCGSAARCLGGAYFFIGNPE